MVLYTHSKAQVHRAANCFHYSWISLEYLYLTCPHRICFPALLILPTHSCTAIRPREGKSLAQGLLPGRVRTRPLPTEPEGLLKTKPSASVGRQGIRHVLASGLVTEPNEPCPAPAWQVPPHLSRQPYDWECIVIARGQVPGKYV